MAEIDTQLTVEYVQSLNWESVVEGSVYDACHRFTNPLFRLATECENRGDLLARDAYLILGHCAGLEMITSEPRTPFRPSIVSSNHRSWNLDSIDQSLATLLGDLAAVTQNLEMRARLGDVAWVTGRNFRSAQQAVRTYIELSSHLNDQGKWLDARDRLERGLRLSTSLGKGGADLRSQVLKRIEADIWHPDTQERSRYLQVARLMELLVEFEGGDAGKLYLLAKERAERAEDMRGLGWETARDYWHLTAQWADRLGSSSSAHHARVQVAETYVSIAEEFLCKEPPDHLSASIQLQMAVELLRQLKEAERAEQVHSRMLEHQELSMTQLHEGRQDFNIAHLAENASAAVKEKTIYQALISLALIAPVPAKAQLSQMVEAQSDDALFSGLVASPERIDGSGRVIGKYPPGNSNDSDAFLEASMLGTANLFRHLIIVVCVLPAVRQIQLEHRVRLDDVQSLAEYNPFVPPGRELIFARGLLAGLDGDFLVANHVLIPQIENSLRNLLEREGVITSNLSSEGIQEQFNLSRVLDHPMTKSVLGDDLWFDLRGLLVESLGSNWRNSTSHGLSSYDDFYQSPSVYVWWVSLRLCVLALLGQFNRKADSPSSAFAGK